MGAGFQREKTTYSGGSRLEPRRRVPVPTRKDLAILRHSPG